MAGNINLTVILSALALTSPAHQDTRVWRAQLAGVERGPGAWSAVKEWSVHLTSSATQMSTGHAALLFVPAIQSPAQQTPHAPPTVHHKPCALGAAVTASPVPRGQSACSNTHPTDTKLPLALPSAPIRPVPMDSIATSTQEPGGATEQPFRVSHIGAAAT